VNLGKLQIPKIDIEPFAFIHDFSTRTYVQYAEILGKSTEGRDVVEALTNDQRVIALSDRMISSGNTSSRFEIKTLAMWFLW